MSCGDNNEGLTALFYKTQNVCLSEKVCDVNDIIQAPSDFNIIGKNFIFIEPKLDTMLSIYNIEYKNHTKILTKGQGPNEMIDIQSIEIGQNDNEVSVYDVLTKKMFLIDLSTKSIRKDSLFEQLKDSLDISCMSYHNSLSIYTLVNNDKHFCLVNDSIYISFGDMNFAPDINPKTLSNVILGYSKLSKQNQKIVWASMFGDIIEIFDYSDLRNIKLVKSIVLNIPDVDFMGSLLGSTNLGVMSLTYSDKFIYALYSGKTLNLLKQIVSGGETYKLKIGQNILIFDWNGNPIKRINVDKDVFSICYDNITDTLYCLGLDEQGDFAIFKMSNNNLE